MKKTELVKILYSRVRLLPVALREDVYGNRLHPVDNDWIVQEITDTTLKLHYAGTGHTPVLGLDQIASWTSDPQRNVGTEKHGFLRLHVQLTLRGNDVRIDLLGRGVTEQRMQYQEPYFYQDGDDRPMCPKCWQKDRRAVYMGQQQIWRGGVRRTCPVCDWCNFDESPKPLIATGSFPQRRRIMIPRHRWPIRPDEFEW